MKEHENHNTSDELNEKIVVELGNFVEQLMSKARIKHEIIDTKSDKVYKEFLFLINNHLS